MPLNLYRVDQPISIEIFIMIFLAAHILNIVNKKFVLLLQLGDIVQDISPLFKYVVKTNQYSNIDYNMPVKSI